MALATGDKKAETGNAAAKNTAQEEMMMEEMMMQKTREAYEKAKLEASENHVPEGTAQEADDAGHTMGIGAFEAGEGAELEIPALNGLIEGVFGGATVHIDNVTIHIGDHMESVNFMGDTEVETEETEEEMEAGEWGDGDVQEDGSTCCDECGFGTGHPIYVDTDLMEKVVAISTGLDRKNVAAVLKGVGLYLQVLAEDEEEKGERDGR